MNKRGQLFIVASLIIVTILLGLGVVHNSVKVGPEDKSGEYIADQIKYEMTQRIDYLMNSDRGYHRDSSDISPSIQQLGDYYAQLYVPYRIHILYVGWDKPEVLNSFSFVGGQSVIDWPDDDFIQKPQILISGSNFALIVNGSDSASSHNSYKFFNQSKKVYYQWNIINGTKQVRINARVLLSFKSRL